MYGVGHLQDWDCSTFGLHNIITSREWAGGTPFPYTSSNLVNLQSRATYTGRAERVKRVWSKGTPNADKHEGNMEK